VTGSFGGAPSYYMSADRCPRCLTAMYLPTYLPTYHTHTISPFPFPFPLRFHVWRRIPGEVLLLLPVAPFSQNACHVPLLQPQDNAAARHSERPGFSIALRTLRLCSIVLCISHGREPGGHPQPPWNGTLVSISADLRLEARPALHSPR
jgi:hypothetical protein